MSVNQEAFDYIKGKEKDVSELKQQFINLTFKERDVQFVNKIDERLPFELLDNRPIIEGKVLGLFFNDINMYHEYNKIITHKDFMTVEGRTYFNLLENLVKMKYKVIDDITINSYLSQLNQQQLQLISGYDICGTIKELKKTNINNAEADIDELLKYNYICKLYLRKFDVLPLLDKLKQMTCSQVHDYFGSNIDDAYIHVSSDTKEVDLTQGYEDFIDRIESGENKGIPLKQNMFFSNIINGINTGITLVCAHSGQGKSSSIVSFILDLANQGKKCVILANEEDAYTWQKKLVASVISNGYIDNGEKRTKWVSRKKFNTGGLTEEEKESINKAIQWLNSKKDKIIFVPLEDYSYDKMEVLIKKHARESDDGEMILFIDTFKPSIEGEYAQFTEESKKLFNLVKDKSLGGLGIPTICTMQLSNATVNQPYLSMDTLAKSKSVVEVAHLMLCLKKATPQQLDPKSKDYIKPFQYTTSGDKREITLREGGHYCIGFINKNRNGASDIQVLWEAELDVNRWKCIGYCEVKQSYAFYH